MGQEHQRFVARAEAGKGWRIWDSKTKRFWGQTYSQYPAALLVELNGQKRSEQLTEFARQITRNRW